jgi:hypothetical protein
MSGSLSRMVRVSDADANTIRILALLAAVLAAVLVLTWLKWLRQKRVKLQVVPKEPFQKRIDDLEQVTASAGEWRQRIEANEARDADLEETVTALREAIVEAFAAAGQPVPEKLARRARLRVVS